jgi:uncharacterized membrane protein (UPF0136 family)
MADDGTPYLWQYNPSFPLAVLFTVIYGLSFFWITYLIVRNRAWYFITVSVGALIEIAGYAQRCQSVKNPYDLVRPLPLPHWHATSERASEQRCR